MDRRNKRYQRYYNHSEWAHFKNRLYNPGPRGDQGLEHSEGRHFALLVTLRLGDFKFIQNNLMAITTDGDFIMLKLGRLMYVST